jgi:hypothetical protein
MRKRQHWQTCAGPESAGQTLGSGKRWKAVATGTGSASFSRSRPAPRADVYINQVSLYLYMSVYTQGTLCLPHWSDRTTWAMCSCCPTYIYSQYAGHGCACSSVRAQTSLPFNPTVVYCYSLFRIPGLRLFVTVFLRPLSPCDLVCAESKLAARATPFCPSLLRHKRHGANWAPNIRCPNHVRCCVAQTFCLPSFVFSRSLRSVFHTLVASMVLFPCFKWVAIRRAQIAVEGF